MEILKNCSLKEYNTFGIDVSANLLVKYSNEQELLSFIELYHSEISQMPLLHIGCGSNLLFLSDFPGIILFSEIKDISILSEDDDSVLVSVGAGITHDDFVVYAIQHGWYGLENLSLIPGQVGSSAVQNIGAYGVEVGSLIKKVYTISLEDGITRAWDHDELCYSYRHSIFNASMSLSLSFWFLIATRIRLVPASAVLVSQLRMRMSKRTRSSRVRPAEV